MKKTAAAKKAQLTEYVSVTDNVYQTGTSFRVRMTINGERYSKNFSSRQKAVRYRNELRRNAA